MLSQISRTSARIPFAVCLRNLQIKIKYKLSAELHHRRNLHTYDDDTKTFSFTFAAVAACDARRIKTAITDKISSCVSPMKERANVRSTFPLIERSQCDDIIALKHSHKKNPTTAPMPRIRAAHAFPLGCSVRGRVSTIKARSTAWTVKGLSEELIPHDVVERPGSPTLIEKSIQ